MKIKLSALYMFIIFLCNPNVIIGMQKKSTVTVSAQATFKDITLLKENDIKKAVTLGLMKENDYPIFINVNNIKITNSTLNNNDKACLETTLNNISIPLRSLCSNFDADNPVIGNKITLSLQQQNIALEFDNVPSQEIIKKIDSFKNHPHYEILARDFLLKKKYLAPTEKDSLNLYWEHGSESPFYKQQTIKKMQTIKKTIKRLETQYQEMASSIQEEPNTQSKTPVEKTKDSLTTKLEQQSSTVNNNNKLTKWFSSYTIFGFGIPIAIFCFFLYCKLKR